MDDSKEPVISQDPLSLKIDDNVWLKVVKEKIELNEKELESKHHLKERRERHQKYYLGKQVDIKDQKDYEGKWLDNIIWESERQIKAISVSKMPDFIVTPGIEGEDSQKTAEDVSKVIDARSKKRERRQVLTMAFKREPIDLVGVIKWFWNPELGKHGDIDYDWVLGEDIVIDAFSKTNEERGMDLIAERLHTTLKELIVRFPDKKKDIIAEALKDGIKANEKGEIDEKGLATHVTPWEVWFTWYEDAGNGQFERLEGVGWKYHDLVLKKMKDPNWDWTGERRLFSYKEPVTEQQMRESAVTGEDIPGFREEKVFRNYFKNPEKPYIFMCADMLGDSPISVTSRIEQLILMQYTLDERGKVIAEKLKNRTKHVFSKDSGLKAEDIEEMDLNDPDVDILVKGKVNEVHGFIPPDLPSVQEIGDYANTRSIMFAKAGVSATRGELQSDVATTNQIGRESDFTLDDNLVDETITYAAERMARADLQLTKLRRNEEDFVEILGEDGKTTFLKIHRDMINDGMQVIATASGTDKIKAERRALEMAKLKLIDPHTFYKDIGASDPSGRTQKLMLFLQSPAEYMAKYGMGLKNSQEMGNKLNGADGQQALLDIQLLQTGQQPQIPENPNPEYLDTFNNFLQSQEFLGLPPEVQQMVQEFIQGVLQKAQGQAENPAAQQFGQGGETSQSAQNPTPTNTAAVATEAPVVAEASPRTL